MEGVPSLSLEMRKTEAQGGQIEPDVTQTDSDLGLPGPSSALPSSPCQFFWYGFLGDVQAYKFSGYLYLMADEDVCYFYFLISFCVNFLLLPSYLIFFFFFPLQSCFTCFIFDLHSFSHSIHHFAILETCN